MRFLVVLLLAAAVACSDSPAPTPPVKPEPTTQTTNPLAETVAEKDYEIVQLKDVVNQAQAAISRLAALVKELGGVPPNVVLTPPTTVP